MTEKQVEILIQEIINAQKDMQEIIKSLLKTAIEQSNKINSLHEKIEILEKKLNELRE